MAAQFSKRRQQHGDIIAIKLHCVRPLVRVHQLLSIRVENVSLIDGALEAFGSLRAVNV